MTAASAASVVTVVRGARLPAPGAPGGLSGPHDVVVHDDRVVAVTPSGTAAASARAAGGESRVTVLDADGRVALPGFVDAHVHGAAAVLHPDVQLAMLRQGVTSVVVGQDGVGFAPSPTPAEVAAGAPDAAAWATGYFAAIDGAHPTFRGGRLADLLATYAGTTALHVGALVPHGTLRYGVLGGAARAATPDEVARMVAVLEEALDDGALGLSTGLEYVPAAAADAAELVALLAAAARRGLPHVSHMRGYEEKAGPAFAELVRLARASGVATHVSHYHGPADALAGYVDAARADGLDVTFDSYPYLRGCSILSMVSLPSWVPVAEPARAVAMLQDEAVLARLHAEHLPALADLWPRVTMAVVPGELSWTEGMALPDVAARLGTSPAEAVVRLLVSSDLRAGCVFAQPPTSSPESVRALLRHPAQLAGSDAIYVPVDGGGRPHPRGWGAFARFLAEHVVRLGDWSWHDAEQHLSAAAARRFGLADRGSLRPGALADVVLVDPERVRDEATYDHPRRLATGIDDVLVAGVPVLADGALTGATPGRVLRPSPHTTSDPTTADRAVPDRSPA